MGNSDKSYGCLCFFTIVFFLIGAFFGGMSLYTLYWQESTAEDLGGAIGEILARLIFGAFGILLAIAAGVIFLVLLIIYIVKKTRHSSSKTSFSI